jgi:hypothetical protein
MGLEGGGLGLKLELDVVADFTVSFTRVAS